MALLNIRNDLDSWLNYIGSVHPSTIDLGLERISDVAKTLELYPFLPYVITVGGTNGKGSTTSLLESFLTKSNYKTGAYFSPHLIRFNERIRIDGAEVSDDEICSAFEKIEEARGERSLTYFEFVTLAALLIFKNSHVDVVVLEVGMGGRFDAVNIVDPDISVITNVGLDHCDWLGSDRESIAKEKAGIMREETPLVYGESDLPKVISEKAEELKTPLYIATKDFYININDCGEERLIWKGVSLPKPKNIYLDDVAIALQVRDLISNRFSISKETLADTFRNLSIPGRFQIITEPVKQIFDVAHNPHAVNVFAKRLQRDPCLGKTYALFSMLNDKDIEKTIKIMEPYVDHWSIAELNVARAAPLDKLIDAFKNRGADSVSTFPSLIEGYQETIEKMNDHDRLLIFGSFHAVAECYSYFVHVPRTDSSSR